MNSKNWRFLVLYLVVFALAVVFGPLVIIWAANTLFPVLAIPYNIWTWLAVVVFNLRYVSLTKVANKKGSE